MHSIGAGMRARTAHQIKYTLIQSSLEGVTGVPQCELVELWGFTVRGKPLCEREVPSKKLWAGMCEHSAHRITLIFIQIYRKFLYFVQRGRNHFKMDV